MISRIVSGLIVLVLFLGATQGFAKTVNPDGTVVITQQTVIDAGGFPFKITDSGSYKLGSNLVVPANTSGIQILANDVTLDLNGFSITGGLVCDNLGNCTPPTVTTKGIEAVIGQVNGQLSNIFGVTIRNGHVRGFVFGISTFGGLVEGITAQGNLDTGITATDAIVRNNDASRNHSLGIGCNQCVVKDNVAAFNTDVQIVMAFGGVFSGNTAVTNQPNGLGVNIDPTKVISDNNNSCNSFRC